MCWICAHPGATERDYQDHMRQLIAIYGWAVQGVERDGIHPPWAYTIGLTRYRRPELVVTGMGLTRATEVLNGVAIHLLHAEAPAPGTQATLLDGPARRDRQGRHAVGAPEPGRRVLRTAHPGPAAGARR